jgi:4-alpha-glucanotransferase
VINCVVYSGTHDNNTTLGWWQSEVDDRVRQFISTYLARQIEDPAWTLTFAGMASVGHTFITTMQDVLKLDAGARMNTPGRPAGNWTWRFTPEQFEPVSGDPLRFITRLYQRAPDQQQKKYGDAAMN